jgi:hypothetical protein
VVESEKLEGQRVSEGVQEGQREGGVSVAASPGAEAHRVATRWTDSEGAHLPEKGCVLQRREPRRWRKKPEKGVDELTRWLGQTPPASPAAALSVQDVQDDAKYIGIHSDSDQAYGSCYNAITWLTSEEICRARLGTRRTWANWLALSMVVATQRSVGTSVTRHPDQRSEALPVRILPWRSTPSPRS